MTTQQVKEMLERDRLTHIDMLEPLRWGAARVLAASPSGVVAEMPAEGIWFVTAEGPAAALELTEGKGKPRAIVTHQAEYNGVLGERFGLAPDMQVVNAVRFDPAPLPEPDTGVEVRPIGPEYLDFVRQHYGYPSPEYYLRGRLESGGMLGAFVNGEPAGFVGEHEEGALGMLTVLPAYRRRGVGRALAARLINRRQQQDRLPYGQIVVGNTVSMAMQRALGFEVGTQALTWLE